jgi:hypothetical protein
MTDKDKALKQALELIERLNMRGWILADFEDEVYATLNSLKAALEQPVQEQQQVGPVEDMLLRRAVLRSAKIVSDGRFVTKQPPLPVQPEPVKLRRGDILRCMESNALCTVWSTSTTGWTLVKWAANDFGSYTAKQIGELFWIEQQAKPVAWDKPSDNFNEWWNGDYEDPANPFEKDSGAYWAWAGWKAAQRKWVGLTDEAIWEIWHRMPKDGAITVSAFARAIEAAHNIKEQP